VRATLGTVFDRDFQEDLLIQNELTSKIYPAGVSSFFFNYFSASCQSLPH
jgi:hypothetical protein